jgi:hypothetical protein
MGCVPEYDYAGHYDMTYSISLEYEDEECREVFGGSAVVTVRDGVGAKLLVDLGGDLCALFADYTRDAAFDYPYLWVEPQECVFERDGELIEALLGGVGTVFEGADVTEFSLALRGSFLRGQSHGAVAIDMVESW